MCILTAQKVEYAALNSGKHWMEILGISQRVALSMAHIEHELW